MESKIAEIAGKMTITQRRAILEANDCTGPAYVTPLWEVRAKGGGAASLQGKRITSIRALRTISGGLRNVYALTPLGLAVRAYLQEQRS